MCHDSCDYEVVQPRPPDYGYTDSLPPGSGCLDSPRILTPEGSPPAEINISRSPDRLQTEISVTSTEMAGVSPPVNIDICKIPDVLPIAMSVKTGMSDKSMEMDTPAGVVSRMEMTGGSPPAEIDISRGPDMLQISVTATEMAGGSPPADIDICVIPDVLPIAMSVKTWMSDMSMEKDTSDVSRLEVAGGSPPAEIVINGNPDVPQRAVSVTAVVSEKWMERFVMNLQVLCSDDLAPDENPARRSSDVGSDDCVLQDSIPTVVSVRTVVTEEWMDRFVLDLVECPSVSRTSAVARTFGPAVSEEYSPGFVLLGGRGGCRCMPPGCRRVRHSSGVWPTVGGVRYSSAVWPTVGWVRYQRECLSCLLPVVSSRPFFFGKVALDVVGLGAGPPCLQVDSEETLLTLTDERAQLARAAPGVTPVDSSEKGAPVRELIWPSVPGEPLVDCLQEPMPGEKSLEYAIQATASVWMPFEQVHNVESGDVDFDSFRMAPWDVGGMHSRTRSEPFRTMVLRGSMYRPVIVHGLNRDTTENTENGLDTIRMITTDYPRLTATPGECYAREVITQIRRDLGHTHDNSAAVNCSAGELDDLIFRRLNLPPENDSAGCDGTYGSPKSDSAAALTVAQSD